MPPDGDNPLPESKPKRSVKYQFNPASGCFLRKFSHNRLQSALHTINTKRLSGQTAQGIAVHTVRAGPTNRIRMRNPLHVINRTSR